MHSSGIKWLLWVGCITLISGQKQIINFAFFYPFFSNELPHPETYNTTEVVQYGIDLFNQSALGQKYELNMKIFNSKCTAEGGNRVYIEMLQETENYAFIIGPACTIAAEPVVLDIEDKNILAISYFVASHQFSDNQTYPNFFRLYPTELTLVNARANFINSQGWRRVGILVQTVSVFTTGIQTLQNSFTKLGIKSDIYLLYDIDTIDDFVTDLLNARYSIIIGLFYTDFANRVLCEARNRNFEIQFVWLIDGWFPEDFYNTVDEPNCTPENVRDFLDYSLFFRNDLTPTNKSEPTILGPSYNTMNEMFNSSIVEDNLVFDSFMTMTAAIMEYDRLYGNNASLNLGSFDYGRRDITTNLRSILRGLDIQGTTGPIKFTEGGDRFADVIIDQFLNGRRQVVGTSSGAGPGINLTDQLTWPAGQPPSDGSRVQPSYISLPQFILFSCLAVIGIVTSSAYIVVTVIKWKHKAISCNTPLLTTSTLIGSIILYIGTIVLQIPNLEYLPTDPIAFSITCNIINWVLTIGFTISFYPLFLKMVYAFYVKEYTLKNVGRRIKFQLNENHLMICLGCFLIIDFIYLLLWSAIPQIRFMLQTRVSTSIVQNLPVSIIEYTCGANYEVDGNIVIGLLIASKAIVLVIAMVIAFDTRFIKYRKHRENIWVGISLYTVGILGVIGIICHQFIVEQADLRFGLVVICILIAVAATTNLLYIPILVLITKDRKGRFEYGVEIGKSELNDSDFVDQYKSRIRKLEQENLELKGDKKIRSQSQQYLVRDSAGYNVSQENMAPIPENQVKSESIL